MTPDTQINSIEDLRGILSKIRFAPSCLDLGWDWEVSVYCQELDGWNVRATFLRPDTDTGEVGTGKGRWWFVPHGSTSSGLVKTAWLACQQVVHHELMEAFTFDGVRIFDPHAEVGALCDANRPPRPWRSGYWLPVL